MRIAVYSASPAVTRTLEAIIACGGHQRTTAEDAELLIHDTIHPIALPPTGARILTLTNSGTTDTQQLAYPIRPAQLKRALAALDAPAPLQIGHGWSVDLMARNLVHADSAPVALTEKETTLLGALASAYPAATGRDALLTTVWGISSDIDTHTLETHIYRLRSKIAALSPPAGDIVTEEGAYKLVMADFPAENAPNA